VGPIVQRLRERRKVKRAAASYWATGCFMGRAGRVLGHKRTREREEAGWATLACGLRKREKGRWAG
jgi:hypothetical protein